MDTIVCDDMLCKGGCQSIHSLALAGRRSSGCQTRIASVTPKKAPRMAAMAVQAPVGIDRSIPEYMTSTPTTTFPPNAMSTS